jgi:DnaK suppressor protein
MKNPGIDKTHFREKLLKLRKELQQIEQTGDDAAQTVELDQSRVGRLSRMDALQTQAMSVESRRRRRITMQRINAALQRIDKDEFGMCLECEESIDHKRLEIDPASPFCFECAEKREKS